MPNVLQVSVGVNFLEDVEIDSMSLGPLWSKTSPMFCMRLASFNRFFAVLAASMVHIQLVPYVVMRLDTKVQKHNVCSARRITLVVFAWSARFQDVPLTCFTNIWIK